MTLFVTGAVLMLISGLWLFHDDKRKSTESRVSSYFGKVFIWVLGLQFMIIGGFGIFFTQIFRMTP